MLLYMFLGVVSDFPNYENVHILCYASTVIYLWTTMFNLLYYLIYILCMFHFTDNTMPLK